MTCKHLWEPNDFGIKPHISNLYMYKCRRCGQIISAVLKDKTSNREKQID